jgi:hypothetical protein
LIHTSAVLKQLNQIYTSLPPQQAYNWSKSPWQEPFTCKHVSSQTRYCMIMNYGCKLPHGFLSYITARDFVALSSVILLQDWLTEEWICRMSWVVKL